VGEGIERFTGTADGRDLVNGLIAQISPARTRERRHHEASWKLDIGPSNNESHE